MDRAGDILKNLTTGLEMRTAGIVAAPAPQDAATVKISKRSLKQNRDFNAERKAAQSNLVNTAVAIRDARDTGLLGNEVFQIAQALILCGLPYKETTATKISRDARLADGSRVVVTFSATLEGIGMPFGSDRSLLHFILDKAIKAKSRFVSWTTATEFLAAMRMNTHSGKNTKDLRARFDRIRGLTIAVQRYVSARGNANATFVMPVIRRSHLPNSVDKRQEDIGQQLLPLTDDVVYGVEMGEDFYNEFMRFHVPVPAAIIRDTRKQSQSQDLILFLYWRCFAAQRESVIPWESLRQQLSHNDSNERRIKTLFRNAIRTTKVFWPEMQAEVRSEGLWIAPPRNGQYLVTKVVRQLPSA